MSWNRLIRQTHRWVSLVFSVLVAFLTVVSLTQEAPPEWIFYLPLPLLAVLLLTGLYMFVLPYLGGRQAGGVGQALD